MKPIILLKNIVSLDEHWTAGLPEGCHHYCPACADLAKLDTFVMGDRTPQCPQCGHRTLQPFKNHEEVWHCCHCDFVYKLVADEDVPDEDDSHEPYRSPWVTKFGYVNDCDGASVCRMDCTSGQRANTSAPLIAAAPELLAALQNLVERKLIKDTDNDHYDEVLEAIAKATRETL